MSTGQTLINRALRLIGVIQSGGSPSSDESADALIALNAMLDSWRNDRLMAYSLTDVSKAMTIGDASYTIVASGDFNTPRPVEIRSAFMRTGNYDYPVKICTDAEWFAIPDKTVTSDLVTHLWYNPTMASGTVEVWPVPSATNTLHLVLWTPIVDLTLVGTVSLPPGWERAISSNLAIDIAPEFGATVQPSVAKMATESLAAIRRRNSGTIKMSSGLPGTQRNTGSSIITGGL